MATAEDILKAFWGAYREAERHGVQDPLKTLHAYATAWLAWLGYDEPARPDIISGYRSPVHQVALLKRWLEGDRVGIKYRPATRSWHMAGLAIDVETGVRGYPAYESIMRYLGARVGADWGDPGHFDTPIPGKEPPEIRVT